MVLVTDDTAGSVADAVTLPDGANVLVTSPVMTGKRRVMHALLADGDPGSRGTALVTTRRPGPAVEREFRSFADVPSDRLTVVDCVGRAGGFGSSGGPASERYVSDPGDLTGVGIELMKFMRRYHEAGSEARVGLHSLSTMLMYADLKRVFQFLHVVTGRIAGSGFVGVFTLDDAVVSGREQSVLYQSFDALVELRERETLELRVRGESFGPDDWTPVRLPRRQVQ